MLKRHIIGSIKRRLPFDGDSAFSSGGRRLLAAAALLHVAVALSLFWAGRAEVAPGLIDRDGIMGSFAFDSYDYQREAARLAEALRRDGVRAWAKESAPLHVKLISVEFALLGPLFGYSILSAEPLNLLCYLAVVALALALGREVGGPRVGLFSAAAVALWPTFLLHTVQLLKDPLFIAGALALVLCVTTWLTRVYDRRGAVRICALMAGAAFVILLVRLHIGVAVLALVLGGLALLAVRQLREGRLLYWNTACPLLLLAVAGALVPFFMPHQRGQQLKRYPSDQGGQPKAVAGGGAQAPTVVSYRARPRLPDSGVPLPFAEPLLAAADNAARRVSSVRSKFAAAYTDAGSGIDRGAEFRDFTELALYTPRAFAVGLWAPFPDTWADAGRRVGSLGRLLSGAETLVIYLCQLLALLAVLRGPRRLASWLLLSVTAFGVTALGLVIPNVGALYRFRYTFWILLIVLGVKGLEIVVTSSGRWLRRPRGLKMRAAAAAAVLLACLLAAGCSRPPQADWTGGRSLTLDNSTGASFRALYLSPSDSAGWEENVLGGKGLPDGETVDIHFSPEEKAVLWDVRVEATDGHYAEWKRLDLNEISRMRLLVGLAGEPVVVAEVE